MIIRFEFKKFLKEPSNLIFLVGLPIIMLFILGKTSPGFSASELLKHITIPEDYQSVMVKQDGLKMVYDIMDYFGVTMLMMLTFLTCVLGANSFSEEYRLKTINRYFCSGKSRTAIFIQKVLGLVIIAAAELLFFFVIAKLLFGIHFAKGREEEIMILAMAFENSLVMLVAGSMLGMIFKKNTLPFIMPFFCIMMLFGGTFTGNIYIAGLSEAMPIYQMQIAAFRLGTLHSYELIRPIMLIEGLILIALFIGAFFMFHKQDEVR